MIQATITKNEAGKRVVDANNEEMGIVTGVTDGVADVDPDPSISNRIRSTLGWREGDLTLEAAQIETIDETTIRLKPEF